MKNIIRNNSKNTENKLIKRLTAILLGVIMISGFTACHDNNTDEISDSTLDNISESTTESNTMSVTAAIEISPDKYTKYIKNYVGKNCATIGYTALNGKRMDRYGNGYMQLVFVTSDGSYLDIESDDILKEYSVVKQNLSPNTVLKFTFLKDSDGKEYDGLIESQNYEEIVLCVKKNGEKEQKAVELTEIKAASDKYTRYIADYVGRNLATCGYASLTGDLMQQYGNGYVKLIIVADDGSYVDPKDVESLRNYVVIGQNLSPNTELKLTYCIDSKGVESDNLVETQNFNEIELTVKKLSVES